MRMVRRVVSISSFHPIGNHEILALQDNLRVIARRYHDSEILGVFDFLMDLIGPR